MNVLLTKKFVPKMVFVLRTLLCKRIDILLVRVEVHVIGGIFLSDIASELADRNCRSRRCSLVYIHVFGFVDCAVGSLVLTSVAHVLVECSLAVGCAVCSGRGLFGLLLLDLLVGLGLGNDVCQEFEVLHTSDCVGCGCVSVLPESATVEQGILTNVTVLDVPSRFALRLDDVVRLFNEMLQ